MSSAPTASDPEINRLISFWFAGGQEAYKKWFMGGASFDEDIRTGFEPLVKRARASELEAWRTSPKGNLALLILLDQMPRNLYRGSALSYSSDEQARDIAVSAIAKGVDRELGIMERTFFYLPLMHHENMISQIAALAFYENLLSKCGTDGEKELEGYIGMGVGFAQRHISCISRFGRFPARNKALGRESTEEEIKYLEENAAGF